MRPYPCKWPLQWTPSNLEAYSSTVTSSFSLPSSSISMFPHPNSLLMSTLSILSPCGLCQSSYNNYDEHSRCSWWQLHAVLHALLALCAHQPVLGHPGMGMRCPTQCYIWWSPRVKQYLGLLVKRGSGQTPYMLTMKNGFAAYVQPVWCPPHHVHQPEVGCTDSCLACMGIGLSGCNTIV